MKVEGLVFAGVGTLAFVPPDYVQPPADTLLCFRSRHFRAPDGRRFEPLDRNV